MDAFARLRPDMSSRRNLVLAFVRDYISQWKLSPSCGEIAEGVGTSRTTVKRLVRSLVQDGHLLRIAGPRGLALPADEAAAVDRLIALGWRIDSQDRTVCGPHWPLPSAAVLDYPEV